jgi:methylated-DNA-[protein]-cysteine S-methyltransferase
MPSPSTERLVLDRLATPIGKALVVTDADGVLRAVDWADYEPRLHRLLKRHWGAVELTAGPSPGPVRDGFDAYFGGELDALGRLSWRTAGTDFQTRIWTALCAIPPGTTRSYGALASGIGAPGAIRAAGAANGANPIGVVVPCHRVIGAAGGLTGYGGGLERKRWLLRHEGADFHNSAPI